MLQGLFRERRDAKGVRGRYICLKARRGEWYCGDAVGLTSHRKVRLYILKTGLDNWLIDLQT